MKINVDENERERAREREKTERTMSWIDAFLFQDIIQP